MARPIAPTPDFEGEAAEKLIREMLEPPSEKHKKISWRNEKTKTCVNVLTIFF